MKIYITRTIADFEYHAYKSKKGAMRKLLSELFKATDNKEFITNEIAEYLCQDNGAWSVAKPWGNTQDGEVICECFEVEIED